MQFLEGVGEAAGLAPRSEPEGHQAAGQGHPGKDRQAEGLDHPGQPLVGGPLRELQPQEVQAIFPGQFEPFRGVGDPLAEPGLGGRKTRARYARP